MFSMLNFTFNFPTRLQFLSLYLHVFVKITMGDACMLHVWIVIQCCNLLCVGFTMNSAYGRMACYTCMDHASQDNWPGHPIVCMLGAFNLLQIRRTHKNINSSCLGAAMCRTQEGWCQNWVTKWCEIAPPSHKDFPTPPIVVDKKYMASHKPWWAHNTLCQYPHPMQRCASTFFNIQHAIYSCKCDFLETTIDSL